MSPAPGPETTTERAVKDIRRALAEPERWCISGRCAATNWGGTDRLHIRSSDCPPFRKTELHGYLRRAGVEPDDLAHAPRPGQRGLAERPWVEYERAVLQEIVANAPGHRDDHGDITPDWIANITQAMLNNRALLAQAAAPEAEGQR